MAKRQSPRAVTPLVGTLTERQWQATVEGLLRFYGWRYHHSPDNKPNAAGARQRVGNPGFPDLAATRNLPDVGPELALLELKTETGRLSPGQREWLADLTALAAAVDQANTNAVEAPDWQPPRIIVGTFRPSDRRDLEDLLAGPAGRNVLIGTL